MKHFVLAAVISGALAVSAAPSVSPAPKPPADRPLLAPGERIVLVGDSITEQSFRLPHGFYHVLTNAFSVAAPEAKYDIVPLGYSGFQVGTWIDLARRSSARDEWTWYRDPGWKVGEAFTNGVVGAVVIFLGMNDILQPSVRDDDASLDAWLDSYRVLVDEIERRAKPRLFVFATITPLTADPLSPKNQVRERMNARLRAFAREKGARVAEYGQAVTAVIERYRRFKGPEAQPVPDFVHPGDVGHLAMALELTRTLNEKKTSVWISGLLSRRFRADTETRNPVLSYRFSALRTNRADDDALVYAIDWDWTAAPSRIGRMTGVETIPHVTVTPPEGWTTDVPSFDAHRGRFLVRGAPDRLVNPVLLTAVADGRTNTCTVPIPTPWRVSTSFDELPADPAQAGPWTLTTGTWDYTGFVSPGSLDPYQAFFGFQRDAFYAKRRVYSPVKRDVKAVFSHQTFSATLDLTLSLNGSAVWSVNLDRNGNNRAERIVTLEKGWNEVLVRCGHADWQRQFALDFLPLDGDDLSDVRYAWRDIR